MFQNRKTNSQQQKAHSQSGVTMLELLIVMVLLAVMVGLATPQLLGQRQKRVLLAGQDELVTVLKEAQNKAMVAEEGYAYGVQVTEWADPPTNSVVAEYRVVDENGDEYGRVYRVADSVSLQWSGADRVMFGKLSGEVDGGVVDLDLAVGRYSTEVNLRGVRIDEGELEVN